MQIKKGDIEGAVCSMKKVIELNDDEYVEQKIN